MNAADTKIVICMLQTCVVPTDTNLYSYAADKTCIIAADTILYSCAAYVVLPFFIVQ